MVNKLSYKEYLAIALIIFAIAFVGLLWQKPFNVGASIDSESGYNATTTSTGTFTYPSVVKTGQGMLGSVVITGAAAGVFNLYNATTTDINLRTGNKATSTIVLATFPASAAAGTYTFDRQFTDGLIIDMIGTSPTTTVTFK